MHNKVLTLLYQKSRGFESLDYGHGVVICFLLWNQDMIELRFYSSIPVYQLGLAWNRKKYQTKTRNVYCVDNAHLSQIRHLVSLSSFVVSLLHVLTMVETVEG